MKFERKDGQLLLYFVQCILIMLHTYRIYESGNDILIIPLLLRFLHQCMKRLLLQSQMMHSLEKILPHKIAGNEDKEER